jgi:Imm-5 like putative immunity protein
MRHTPGNHRQNETVWKKATMRDRRFIAEHRGGPLEKEQHYLVITWACDCAEHVLPLFGERTDERLIHALTVAKEWKGGNASVGDAMKASGAAHAVARASSHPASRAVARSVGQAVATAHMADHSLGAAWYALKAVNYAAQSPDAERKWQDEQLPPEIKDLILTARKSRRI